LPWSAVAWHPGAARVLELVRIGVKVDNVAGNVSIGLRVGF
jgi:hypothetical protein